VVDSECSPNYYCGEATSRDLTWKFCIPAKKEGEKCSKDWECQNAYVCSRRLSSHSKTCMTRLALKDGTESVDPRLCQSNMTTSDGICSSISKV
jgi:hypothetical protein